MKAFTTFVLAFAAVSPAAAIPLGSELSIHCENYCMMAQTDYVQSAFTSQRRHALRARMRSRRPRLRKKRSESESTFPKRPALQVPMRSLRRKLRRSSLGSVSISPRKLVSHLHMRNQRHSLPKRTRKRRTKDLSEKQEDIRLCCRIASYGFTGCNQPDLIANDFSIIFFWSYTGRCSLVCHSPLLTLHAMRIKNPLEEA